MTDTRRMNSDTSDQAALCLVATDAQIEAEVLKRLCAFRERLGDELALAFDALAARLRLFEGAEASGYFSHPLALPVLMLPIWVAEHVAQTEPQAIDASQGFAAASSQQLVNLAEAGAVGYLHVRLQDDWVDERVGDADVAMLLSTAFFTRHQALVAYELSQGSPFWQLFEKVWVGYSNAMLVERKVHQQGGVRDLETFKRVLLRSQPLLLPAAAVLFARECTDALPMLEQFVTHLVTAHQLFVDLLHAQKDLSLGNSTYVLSQLTQGVPDVNKTALHTRLYLQGGFDRGIAAAQQELAESRAIAERMAMHQAVRYCEGRARYMAQMQVKVYAMLFSGLQAY